jgi:hypothetical protein
MAASRSDADAIKVIGLCPNLEEKVITGHKRISTETWLTAVGR